MEAMEGKLKSLCPVKACRELEEVFGLKITDGFLNDHEERWGSVIKINETEAG